MTFAGVGGSLIFVVLQQNIERNERTSEDQNADFSIGILSNAWS
jgi:hypothetical protein